MSRPSIAPHSDFQCLYFARAPLLHSGRASPFQKPQSSSPDVETPDTSRE